MGGRGGEGRSEDVYDEVEKPDAGKAMETNKTKINISVNIT